MSLYKYFKRVNISALLPDPKGHLSDHILTASVAEANIEVLKAVAEAKELLFLGMCPLQSSLYTSQQQKDR